MCFQESIMIVCVILLWTLKTSDGAPYTYDPADLKSPSPVLSLYKVGSIPTKQFIMHESKPRSRVNEQTMKSYLNILANDIGKNQKRMPRNDEYREITLYRPKFVKNTKGNWVAVNSINWINTRFNQGPVTIPRMLVEKNVDTHYYPNQKDDLTTVCDKKSTLYNIGDGSYFTKGIHAIILQDRVFYNSLRRGIYSKGSEECHDRKRYTNFLKYWECAAKRNMRLEYYIPFYPLYQRGSLSNYKNYVNMR